MVLAVLALLPGAPALYAADDNSRNPEDAVFDRGTGR